MRTHGLAALLAACVLSSLGTTQTREPNHRNQNTPTIFNAGGYGTYSLGLGDFDGDGFEDYAVAAPSFTIAPGSDFGRVYVYSGRTAELVRSFDGDTPLTRFGVALADIGDVDRDGTPDLVVGAPDHDGAGPNRGRVFCFSGSTGATLWTADGIPGSGNFGHALGAVSDYTGDSVLDVVVSDPGYSATVAGQGRVVYLDGATGSELGAALGTFAFSGLGRSIATRMGVGLVYAADGRGRIFQVDPPLSNPILTTLVQNEVSGAVIEPSMALVAKPGSAGYYLAVGRSNADTNGLINNGTLDLLDGGLPPIWTIDGATALEALGKRVSFTRDVDGDGEEEIAFLATVGNGPTLGGRVRVIDAQAVVLDDVSRQGSQDSHLGSIADVTGDGRGEWLWTVNSSPGLFHEASLFARGLTLTSAGPNVSGDFLATHEVDLGPVNAGAIYLQLHGLSGAWPGTLLGGGTPLVPCVFDGLSSTAIQLQGTPFFPNLLGTLNGLGRATTNVFVPADLASLLTGIPWTSAVVALDPQGTILGTTNPTVMVLP